jgi:hypothetical protein
MPYAALSARHLPDETRTPKSDAVGTACRILPADMPPAGISFVPGGTRESVSLSAIWPANIPLGMDAGPPFTDIMVVARLILRDQQSKDQRRLLVGSEEKSPEIATV